jgi:hypothetical protein
MRAIILSTCAFIAMAAPIEAIDWETLTVNGNPIPPQATVSFSIGYPKGWHVFQNYSQERHDIYNGIATPSQFGPICSFDQLVTNIAAPITNQTFTMYWVLPSDGAPAKDAAEAFFSNKQKTTSYTSTSIKLIKTRAGDSGWLVESEGFLMIGTDPIDSKNAKAFDPNSLIVQLVEIKPTKKIPIIYDDFFFHSGPLGAIHIEIMTERANISRRSQLDDLVLNTLRFNRP